MGLQRSKNPIQKLQWLANPIALGMGFCFVFLLAPGTYFSTALVAATTDALKSIALPSPSANSSSSLDEIKQDQFEASLPRHGRRRNTRFHLKSGTIYSENQVSDTEKLLNDRRVGLNSKGMVDDFFDAHQTQALRIDYERSTRDFDNKRNYNLMNASEEKNYSDQQSHQYGNNLYGQFRSHQAEKVRGAATNADAPAEVKKPLTIAVAAAAIYSGEKFKVAVQDDTELGGQTEFQRKRGEFHLNSSLVNTSVNYVGDAPMQRDPGAGDERYRLSVSRALPVFNLGSSVSYGTSSGGVTASLSREVIPSLTFVLDTTRYIRNDPTDPRSTEQAARILYDIRF